MRDEDKPTYRTLPDGSMEDLLPENVLKLPHPQHAKMEDREAWRKGRIEHCKDAIKLGEERYVCRNFICSEEEWRQACRDARSEPGIKRNYRIYHGDEEV